MLEKMEECINQVAKAQKTLEEVLYLSRGADAVDVLALKLGIARAERYLKTAEGAIVDL